MASVRQFSVEVEMQGKLLLVRVRAGQGWTHMESFLLVKKPDKDMFLK